MAWVSPSRHAVHRRLRIPPLRKGSDSPLRTTRHPSHPGASPSRRLSTPRIPLSDLNVMSRPRSHPSASQWRAPSQEPCRAAHAATGPHVGSFYDTVRLTSFDRMLRRCFGLLGLVDAGFSRIFRESGTESSRREQFWSPDKAVDPRTYFPCSGPRRSHSPARKPTT